MGAMVEIESLDMNQTWDLVELSEANRAIGCKMFIIRKKHYEKRRDKFSRLD